MSRCDGCPADPAHACYAATARLAHLCRLKGRDPDLLALIRDRSGPPPVWTTPDAALALRVDLCGFRESCSCEELRVCTQSTYRVTVRRADCLACAADPRYHP